MVWLKKSVEGYDASVDKWVTMPNMLEGRVYHSSAAIGNKLYVFGGHETSKCEVLDTLTNMFTRIKSAFPFNPRSNSVGPAITLGYKILLFNQFSLEMAVFDVEKEEWSEITKISSEDQTTIPAEMLSRFCCLKLPHK